MESRLFRVIVLVNSIEQASEFYGSLFESKGNRVSPGRHYFDCNDVILACYSPIEDGDDTGKGWLAHENQYLYFAITDLSAMAERIEAGGGTLLSDVQEMPWGETLFYAEDPFGNRLSFVDSKTVFTG